MAVESKSSDDVEAPAEWPAWQKFVYFRFCGCSTQEAADRAGFSGSPSKKAREAWKEAKRTKPRSRGRLRKEKARLERERRELEAKLERTESRLEVIGPKLEASRRGGLASEI